MKDGGRNKGAEKCPRRRGRGEREKWRASQQQPRAEGVVGDERITIENR